MQKMKWPWVSFLFLIKLASLEKIKHSLLKRLSILPLYLGVEIDGLHTPLEEGARQCISQTIKLFITVHPVIPVLKTYLRK